MHPRPDLGTALPPAVDRGLPPRLCRSARRASWACRGRWTTARRPRPSGESIALLGAVFPVPVARVPLGSDFPPSARLKTVLTIFTPSRVSLLILLNPRLAWIGAGLLAGLTLVVSFLAQAFRTMDGAQAVQEVNRCFEHLGPIGDVVLVGYPVVAPRGLDAAEPRAAARKAPPRIGRCRRRRHWTTADPATNRERTPYRASGGGSDVRPPPAPWRPRPR